MAVTVEEKLITVLERIRNAARKAGRDPREISLVAVTKAIDLKKVKEAYSSGIRIFGENYVQETQEKVKKLKRKGIQWHFIGHLQKNKAKIAVELYNVIHTVDNVPLAVELNKRVKNIDKPTIDVLIQVNIAGEKTKSGIDPEGALKLARTISALPYLRLKGLMAIPPRFEDPQMSRPYFVTLRRLAERINKERLPRVALKDLSIGMSQDFEVAIEEGATMVRVGTAIFGEREGSDLKTIVPKAAPVKKAVVKKKSAASKKATVAKSVKKVAVKAVTKKAPVKKAPAKKAAVKAVKKKVAVKKAVPIKKAAVKKKSAAPKKATVAKSVKKVAVKAVIKKTPVKKAPTKKAAVKAVKKKGAVKKAPAKKATLVKKVSAKKKSTAPKKRTVVKVVKPVKKKL